MNNINYAKNIFHGNNFHVIIVGRVQKMCSESQWLEVLNAPAEDPASAYTGTLCITP